MSRFDSLFDALLTVLRHFAGAAPDPDPEATAPAAPAALPPPKESAPAAAPAPPAPAPTPPPEPAPTPPAPTPPAPTPPATARPDYDGPGAALLNQLIDAAADGHIDRRERRAIRAAVRDVRLSPGDRELVVGALFESIGARMHDPHDRRLLGALEELLALVRAPERPRSQAFFGPGDPMVENLLGFLRATKRRLDIAVFTITDDRLFEALVRLHRRGVKIRILTDDDKAGDRGSDVEKLMNAGVPLKLDHDPYHFHHKYAVRDGDCLLGGSYNWTRSADSRNRENLFVTYDPALVSRYQAAFEQMWASL